MIDRMLSGGVIAVVRLPEPADLRPIAAALAAGGVDVVELTLTTPGGVASGGMWLENAGEWIHAGAAAVGVGSALVSPELIRDAAWAELTRRARALVDAVAAARLA